MKIMSSISLVSLILASNINAATLSVLPDVSSSSLIMTNSEYAELLGMAVANKVLPLTYGDKVYFKTIGDDSTKSISKPLTISRKLSIQKAADMVRGRIAKLGQSVKQQGSTNIMSAIENGHFYCDEPNSQVVIASDGIEWSVDFSGEDLLKGKALPKPYGKPLAGCAVIMIGVGRMGNGQRLPRTQIHTLNQTWSTWLKAAGASSVDIMVDPKL